MSAPRMTAAALAAKLSNVNAALADRGITDPAIGNVGALRLYGAYGGTAVHQILNAGGGCSDLSGLGTKREAAIFLDGMRAALRILADAEEVPA